MRGGQRQHDIVFGRRRLHSKLNLRQKRFRSAKPQARLRRLPNGAWITSCMPPLRRRSARRRLRPGSADSRGRVGRGKIVDELFGGGRADADSSASQRRAAPGRVGAQPRGLRRAGAIRTWKARQFGPALPRARTVWSAAGPWRPRPGPSRARPAGCGRRRCRAGRCRRPCFRPRNLRSPSRDRFVRFEHHCNRRCRGLCRRRSARSARAAPAAQDPIDRIAMDEGPAAAPPRGEALGQHADDGVEVAARERAEGPRAAQPIVEGGFGANPGPRLRRRSAGRARRAAGRGFEAGQARRGGRCR